MSRPSPWASSSAGNGSPTACIPPRPCTPKPPPTWASWYPSPRATPWRCGSPACWITSRPTRWSGTTACTPWPSSTGCPWTPCTTTPSGWSPNGCGSTTTTCGPWIPPGFTAPTGIRRGSSPRTMCTPITRISSTWSTWGIPAGSGRTTTRATCAPSMRPPTASPWWWPSSACPPPAASPTSIPWECTRAATPRRNRGG